MKLPEIDLCKCVPDDDPRLCGAQAGMVKVTDRVLYVRESDWLQFLTAVMRAAHGDHEAEKFWRRVIQ